MRENTDRVYVSHVNERENAGLVYSVLYCSPMDERKTGVRVCSLNTLAKSKASSWRYLSKTFIK